MGAQQTDIIDLSFLTSFIDTKEEMEEALTVFLRTTDKSIDALESAIGEKDYPAWISNAHQIKGAASMIGANALKNICEDAESLAQNKFLNEARDHLTKIKAGIRESQTLLRIEIEKMAA